MRITLLTNDKTLRSDPNIYRRWKGSPAATHGKTIELVIALVTK
jgi:hypothetical protein